MADVAQLGIRVDTAPVDKATASLHKLTGAAAVAERTVNGMTAANDNSAAAADQAAAAQMRFAQASKLAAFQQRNLMFQVNDVATSLAMGMNPMMVAMQQGSQIASIYGPEEGGIGRAFKETGKMIVGVLTKFPLVTAAVAGIGAVFAGLTYEINQGTDVAVGFGDVVKATFISAAQAISDLFAPAIASITPYFEAAYNTIRDMTKVAVNGVIGAYVGAFEAIKELWHRFPAVVGEQVIKAAQATIDTVTWMARRAYEVANPGENGDLAISRSILKNPYKGSTASMSSSIYGAFGDAMQQDYVGSAYEKIRSTAIELAKARAETEKTSEATKELEKSWDGVETSVLEVEDRFKGAKEEVKSFMSVFRQGLIDGEGMWGSFLKAATGTLDSISDKLFDLASNQLINSLFGSLLGAGGGNVGGYFGNSGFTNLLSFGGPRASGGPVDPSKTYLVGEKGPELFTPSTAGNITANGAGGNVFNIDARGAQAGVGEEIRRALKDYERNSLSRHIENHQQARKRRAIQ